MFGGVSPVRRIKLRLASLKVVVHSMNVFCCFFKEEKGRCVRLKLQSQEMQ